MKCVSIKFEVRIIALVLLYMSTLFGVKAQTANDDYVSMFVGDSQYIRVLDNDVSISDSTLSVVKAPLYGMVTIMSDTIEYVSMVSTYRDSFQYLVGSGANTSSAWVHIDLSDKPDNVDKFLCSVAPRATDFNIVRTRGAYSSLYTSQVPLVGLMGKKKPSILVESTTQTKLILFDGTNVNAPVDSMNIIKGSTFCLYGRAIADVDGDSIAEIFAITANTAANPVQYFLTAYKFDKATKHYVPMPGWNSTGKSGLASIAVNAYVSNPNNFVKLVYPVPHVVDMNGDGHANIVVYNRVYDAETGKLIASGNIDEFKNSSGGQAGYEYVNVAIGDVDSDGVQDIVNGNMLYGVTINDRTNYAANSVTLLKTIAIPGVGNNGGGNTVLADIDGDGNLEAIVNRRFNKFGQLSPFFFYVWDTKTGTVQYHASLGVCAMGVSAFTVADLNNSGLPDIVFMAPVDSGTNVTRYNTRGTIYGYYWDAASSKLKQQWSFLTSDKSQSTTISAFDFNMDGKMEIIYRGETKLNVFDGSGANLAPIMVDPAAESNTASEYPIVADIDGDGFAEILTVDDPAFTKAPYHSYLAVCRSKTPGSWSPARKVWNQYNYNALTINEDLSVPAHPANRLLRMPNGKQLFNSSLQQVPYVDGYGNSAIPAADLELDSVTHVLNGAGDSVIYTLTVANVSSNAAYLASDSAVAFYCGDATGALLWVGPLPAIDQNDTIQLAITVPLSRITSCSDLVFIQVNDKGMGMGYSGGMQDECNEDSKNSLWISMVTINNDYYSVKVNTKKALPVLDNDSVTAGTKILKLYASNLSLGTAVINPTSDSVLFYAGSKVGVDSFRYVAGAGINDYGTAWAYTVVSDNDTTTIDPLKRESIGANHFVWNVRDLNNLNPSVSKDTAEVTAFSLDGMPIIRDSLDVNTSQLLTIKAQKNATVLPLSFNTYKGTSVQINAILMDNDSTYINPISREVIGANDFIWPVKKAPSLSSLLAKLTAKVNAYTFDGTSIPPALINVDPTELNNIQNETKATVHPLKFTTPNGTPVSINVTMLLNDTIVPGPGGSSIGADYVVWKLKDLNSYTQAIAPDTAHVTAYDKQGKAVPPGFISTDNTKYNYLINTAAVGVYPMTYISPDTFVTANVLMFDNDTITPSPPNSEAIGADHFVWRIRDLVNLNQTNAKDTAHVTAYMYNGTFINKNNINVDIPELNNIKAQKKSIQMPLSFTTPLGTTVTVRATLLDNDSTKPGPNSEAIGADHIIWQLNQLSGFTKTVAKDTARVTAFDSTGIRVDTSNITVDPTQFTYIHTQAAVGTYPLTFSLKDGTSVTVPVIIMDNDTISNDSTHQEVIGANNFIWKLKKLSSLNAAASKAAAHVTAFNFDGSSIPRLSIKVDPAQLSAITNSSVTGTFPLFFSTLKGTSVKINVTLVDNDTTTVTPLESIGADHVLWKLDSLPSFTKPIAIDTAHVNAHHSDGTPIPLASIAVDDPQYNNIFNTKVVGVYPLSFKTLTLGTQVTIAVVVTKNDTTTLDPDSKQSIGADHVVWNIRNLNTYTTTEAKDTAHVTAYNFDGSYISRSNINLDLMQYATITNQTTPGAFPLTYSTPQGVGVQAQVVLLDNDTLVPDSKNNEAIGANHFVWRIKDLASFNQYIAKDTSHVTAMMYDGTFIDTSLIKVNSLQVSAIKAQKKSIQMPLSFTTPLGTTVTVKATLLDNDSTKPGPSSEAIGADHIIWQLNQLPSLTASTAFDSAHVMAFDSTGTLVPKANILVDPTQLNYIHKQAAVGTYPLTFSLKDGTSVTVPVIIMNNDTINPDTTHQEVIGANNFIWKLKKLGSLNAAASKAAAHVTAFNFDGSSIPRLSIKVDPAQLSAITNSSVTGTFPLFFSTLKGTSVKINVTLVDNDTTTVTPLESIGADHVLWKLDSLPSFTKPIAIDTAHVNAHHSDGTPIPLASIAVDDPQYNNIFNTKVVGVYPLSFKTLTLGTQVTIAVVVTKNDTTTLDPDSKQSIGADHVVWNIRNLNTYTTTEAKDTAHVTAYNFDGSYISRNLVIVDHAEYDTIKNQTIPGAFPLTYSTPQGVGVQAQVVLLDNDTLVPDSKNNEAIGANHFVWRIKDLASFNQYIAKDTSHVTAIMYDGTFIDSSLITVNTIQINNIKAQRKSIQMPLSFTTPLGTTVTVKATLLDNDSTKPGPNSEAIGADHIIWQLNQLPSLTALTAYDSAHVTAFDSTGTLVAKANILVDPTQLNYIHKQAAVGTYPLTFSLKDGTNVTVPVIIMDNDTISNDSTNQEVIGANNFIWRLKQVSSLDDIAAKNAAHVTAFNFDGSSIPRLSIKVDPAQLLNITNSSVTGTFPLIFSTTKGSSVKINVTLVDNDTTTIDSAKRESIGADNVVWNIRNLNTYTTTEAKDTAHVTAYNFDGSYISRNLVSVDQAEYDTIKNQTTPGAFPLTYSTPQGVGVQAQVVLLDNDTLVPGPKYQEAIGANHFVWRIRDLASFNQYIAKDTSHVTAIMYDGTFIDTSLISVNTVQINNIKAQRKSIQMPLGFTTPLGTTVTVKATLLDNDSTSQGSNSEAIGADHIIWQLNQLSGFTKTVAKDTAHVTAFDSTGTRVDTSNITVDPAQFSYIHTQASVGTYPLTFSLKDGTGVTVPVIVMDNDTINIDTANQEVIGANNFIWKLKQAKTLTVPQSKAAASVAAYDFKGHGIPRSSIKVDSTQLSAITNSAVVGKFPLTFATPKGTRVQINVTLVYNDTTTIDSTNRESIGADNILWQLDSLSRFTMKVSKDTAHVNAYDSIGGVISVNAVIVDTAEYNYILAKDTVGAFPLSFSTPKGTRVTIHVVVSNNDSTYIDPDDHQFIGADNVLWNIRDLSSYTESMAKDTAHVTAFHFDGSSIPRNLVDVDQTEYNAILAQTTPAVLPMTYNTPSGVAVSANIILLDNDTLVPGPNDEAIGADHIIWQLNQLSGFTKTVAKDTAHVTAFDSTGTRVDTSNITVDPTQFTYIHTQASVGTYPLTFSLKDGTGVTVPVIVMDNDTINIDTANQEVIGANNFIWKLKQAKTLTVPQSKAAASVAAFRFDGGSIPRSSIKVDSTQLSAITNSAVIGKFPLTFATSKRTSVQINVTLVYNDTTTIDSTNRESIGADNILWQLDSLSRFTMKVSKDTAHVNAYDSIGGVISVDAVIVDTAEYNYILAQDTVGAFPLSFSTPKGTRVTIHVVVSNNDSTYIDPDDHQFIGADNVLWNIRDLSSYTESVAKDTAHVTAFHFDGSSIPRNLIDVDQTEYNAILAQTTPAVLPMTYNTPSGVAVSANVILLDNDTLVPGPNEEAIGADHIIWQLNQLFGFTKTVAKDTAHVTAFDSTGTRVDTSNITVDPAQFTYIHTQASIGTYPLTFSLKDGTSVTVPVIVMDNDTINIDTANQEVIGANNFIWKLKQAKTLTVPQSKAAASVAAYDFKGHGIPRSSIKVDSMQLSAISNSSVIGKFPLTFATPKGTSVQINVTLVYNDTTTIDSTNRESIGADNILWQLDSLPSFTMKVSKDTAHVNAYDSIGGMITLNAVIVDTSEYNYILAKDTVGAFPLSFSTPKRTRVTIHVVVSNNDSTYIDPDDHQFIGADNVLWNIRDLSSYTESMAKDTAHVTAFHFDGSSIPRNLVDVDQTEYNAILAQTTPAVLPMTYNTPSGVAVSANVILLDNDTLVPGPNDEAIGADHIIWQLNQLSGFTKTVAKDTAHVTAFDSTGTRVDTSNITVDPAQFNYIHTQASVGTYPLTFSLKDGTGVTVPVIVMDNDTINIDTSNQEVIGANNFIWKLKQAKTLTVQQSKAAASVAAYDFKGHGIPRSSLKVDSTQLSAITNSAVVGKFPLTFATPKGTSVQINVTLVYNDTTTIDSTNRESIGADNILWQLDSLSSFTMKVSKDTAHVNAYDSIGGVIPVNAVIVDTSEYNYILAQDTVGAFPLSFSTPKGTRVTIHVVVSNNDSTYIDPDDHQFIGADNVLWNIRDLSSYTESMAKDTAHVTAFHFDGSSIPRNLIDLDQAEYNSILAQTTPAVLPMTYNTPSGVAVSANVILLDNDTLVPGPNDEAIGADHIIWQLNQLSGFTKTVAKDTAHVTAFDSTGTRVDTSNIAVDPAQFNYIHTQASIGTYPLTFSLKDGTGVTVPVIVMDNDTINIDTANQEVIGANNFIWKLKQAKTLTVPQSKAAASVAAFRFDGGSIPRSSIKVDSTQLSAITNSAVVGKFPLTFATPKGTSVQINVTLVYNDTTTIDSTNRESIGADNILWQLDSLPSFTMKVSKDTAHVNAYDSIGGAISVNAVIVDTAEYNYILAKDTVGAFPLSFSTPKGTRVTIHVVVSNNDSTYIDPDDHQFIGADNVLWNIRDLSSYTESMAKDTAHVTAFHFDGSSIPRNLIDVDQTEYNAILAQTTPAVLPMTYNTPSGVAVSANVILLDNDTLVPNPTKKEAVGADNFVWYLENLNALQAQDAKDTAHVTAFAYDGTLIDRNLITVNSTQLKLIQHQTQESVEPLNYSTPNLTTVGVHVTLVSDSGSYNPICKEYIIGKDISWSVDSIAFLDSATIRTEGKIRGIYTDGTGTAIDPSSIYLNSNDVAAVQGITTADSTVIVHFYTACGTLDSLKIISRTSSNPHPQFTASIEVGALSSVLCTATCDVDFPYIKPFEWGIDTMKRHAVLTVILKGNQDKYATIDYVAQGNIHMLYKTSVADGGKLLLKAQGSDCVGKITIDRDSLFFPEAEGFLSINITIGGETQTVKLKFSNDFDQDGIPNAMERNTCIKRYQEIPNEWYYDDPYGDRDADGIPNIVEAHGTMDSLYLINSDNDCIPDFQDVDSNNDGVPDAVEKFTNNSSDTTSGIYVRPAISPNGDNLGNDKMYIENITKYPDNTVTVFDRVGHIIYKAKHYDNQSVTFDGFPNVGSSMGKKALLGTYYYYVEYFDNTSKTRKEVSGFVEIRY